MPCEMLEEVSNTIPIVGKLFEAVCANAIGISPQQWRKARAATAIENLHKVAHCTATALQSTDGAKPCHMNKAEVQKPQSRCDSQIFFSNK